ncbi:endonuclease-reverse transcriptase [Elysia marginata]|uniref:Endonuclease-reverse transcriptase n=1 Tax=Elysia marginata TaxID=1093978 RepID=A0AAV4EB49_9GAST|nr:endonuclease-reverse transcriptase [Elysia marginata]
MEIDAFFPVRQHRIDTHSKEIKVKMCKAILQFIDEVTFCPKAMPLKSVNDASRLQANKSQRVRDTSSPLTCSACSRVFMTARGLLHHIQTEHGMTICLKKGPLIILDKRLRCPDVTPSPLLENKDRSPPALSQTPHQDAEDKLCSPLAYPAKTRQEDNYICKSEVISEAVGNACELDKQRRGREQLDHEHHEDEPRNLSQRSRSAPKYAGNRFKSEERANPRTLSDQLQQGGSMTDHGESSPDKERMPRSSSVPKKRRFPQNFDQELRALPRGEVFTHTEDGYRSSTGNTEMSSVRKEYTHGDTLDGLERKGTANFSFDGENIDTGQYFSQGKDIDSPICLVVNKVPESQETEAIDAKNIILKKLLSPNGTTTENVDLTAMQEVQSSLVGLPAMPKLEVDTNSLLRNPFDTNYSEADDRAQSTSISSSSSLQQDQPGSYLRARYPRFPPGSSIEQSIEQIIRASVSKEVDDLNVSNDSFERSPPPPLSPRYAGPLALPGAVNSFQGIPMTMPSLIASHQLGSVAGYFSPQPYSPAGPRRGSVGPVPHHLSTGSATTSPGAMSAPEKALDIPNPLDTSGLYSVSNEGPTLPRLALGYQHKTGMGMLRRRASDYTASRGHSNPSMYRGEVDIHQWAAMAGDAYVNSMTNRMPHEQQQAVAPQGISPDLEGAKTFVDGRMKKRRYPTSRPFKCPHCDQAFNQRIHLKKHMSKHTVFNYGCEAWTYSKTVQKKIQTFEMWCFRRLLKVPWTEKKTNKEILQMADVGERLLQQLMKRKLRYAGHIMRGSSGPLLQLCLEGKSKGRENREGQEGTGWTM